MPKYKYVVTMFDGSTMDVEADGFNVSDHGILYIDEYPVHGPKPALIVAAGVWKHVQRTLVEEPGSGEKT